jgi:hypothetical protein
VHQPSTKEQLIREIEELRAKAAEQQLRLEQTRAEYELVCAALAARGIDVPPLEGNPRRRPAKADSTTK